MIFALVAALAVGFLANAGVFGSGAPQVESQSLEEVTPERTGSVPPPDARVGETVEAGGLRWTITDVRTSTEIQSYTLPPESKPGSFVTLDFTVENVSGGPLTLTPDSLAIFGESGVSLPARADVNSKFVRHELNILFNEFALLEPGQKSEGRVNFDLEIPFGAQGEPDPSRYLARAGDADPAAENERFVSLR